MSVQVGNFIVGRQGLTWPSHLSVNFTETCYVQDPTFSWFLKLALMESFRGSLLSNINIMAESGLCSNCGDIKVRQVEQWGLVSSHFVHCGRFIWQKRCNQWWRKVAVIDIITVSLSYSVKFRTCMNPFWRAWNMSVCDSHIVA